MRESGNLFGRVRPDCIALYCEVVDAAQQPPVLVFSCFMRVRGSGKMFRLMDVQKYGQSKGGIGALEIEAEHGPGIGPKGQKSRCFCKTFVLLNAYVECFFFYINTAGVDKVMGKYVGKKVDI